jgi:tetratricopeptide (TPR) repeat protein
MLRNNSKAILTVMPVFASTASNAALENVSHQGRSELDNGLAQLIEMSLIETSDELDTDAIRYSIHPLTRSFAQARLENESDYRDASQRRYIVFFLKYVEENSGWTDWRGLEAIEREWMNVLQAMRLCKSNDYRKEYMQFRALLSNFLWMHNYWEFGIESGKTAIQFASEYKDTKLLSELLQSVGWIQFSQGKLQDARDYYDACAALYKEGLDDPDGSARLHNYYGRLAAMENELPAAQRHFQDGLTLATDPLTVSFCKSALGDVALARGNLEDAYHLYNEVRLLRETSGDRSRLASVLCDLGEVSARQSNYAQAHEFYQRSLDIGLEIGRQDVIGRSRRGLAWTLSLQGQYEAASELAKEALSTFNQLGAIREIEKTKVLLIQILQDELEVSENSSTTERPQ